MTSVLEAAQVVGWSLTWIGAGLLLVAGIAKVRRPAATTETLALAGLPDRPVLARGLGVGEVVLAAVVLATGHRLAALALAGAYTVFAGVAVWLLRTDQGSCGCFGEVDAPLTRVHVVANVVLAGGALAAAVTGPAPVPTSVPALVLLVVAVATGALLVRMLLVLVPALADGIQRLAAE